MSTASVTLASIAEKYGTPEKAREFLEKLLWVDGPVCPQCASKNAHQMVSRADSKHPVRAGLYKCRDCRKKYRVTVGTIFEDSHIPLHKWLMAIFLLCSSKKGISSKQLERSLGITYKTAWFLSHRIRYAMQDGPLCELLKGVVEVDETYVGGYEKRSFKDGVLKTGQSNKTPVVALVERGGNVRARAMHRVTTKNLGAAIAEQVCPTATVVTDESGLYGTVKATHTHHTVNHGKKQYAVRLPSGFVVHSNTAESFFSLLKRGVMGAFHHVSKHHLGRYCDEFSFRWNSRKMKDGERREVALSGFVGKRLKYRDSLS